MKRSEILINELCDEIDHYKEQAEFWRLEYEQEKKERNKELQESFERTKNDIGNTLMLAFNLREMPDGSLSIPIENRKELAAHFKKESEIIDTVLDAREEN